MNTNESHNCDECAWKKKIIIESVDNEDIDVYEKIMTGISTAQAARKQTNFSGEDVSSEIMNAYFSAIMDKEAHYKKLELEWWRNMIEKYAISDFTKIDVMKRQFYVCLDDKGNEKIDYKSKAPEGEKLILIK
jgi:hypothetical protein